MRSNSDRHSGADSKRAKGNFLSENARPQKIRVRSRKQEDAPTSVRDFKPSGGLSGTHTVKHILKRMGLLQSFRRLRLCLHSGQVRVRDSINGIVAFTAKLVADTLLLLANGGLLFICVPLGRILTNVRLAWGVPQSLWGTTPILTLPLKARADLLIGLKSRALVFTTYYITRQFDLNLQEWSEFMVRRAPLLVPLFHRAVLGWVLLKCDVCHFFWDRGLLEGATRFGVNPWELDLLRWAGKRVYLYAYGADVRRRVETLKLGEWNFCRDCPEPGTFCACTEINHQIMSVMSEKITCGLAVGDMLTYVPQVRNMHYWPIDVARFPDSDSPRVHGPFRIAHAPNHTHFKGSKYLENAVHKLSNKGYPIEYLMIQGKPNKDVLQAFAHADLVADQFIGGFYGYTALEAMALGRPVLAYVRGRHLLEAPDECPIISATPDNLEEVLLWCLENRAALRDIGRQGAYYVRRHHSIEAVALRLATMYQETAGFPKATQDRIIRHTKDIRSRLNCMAAPNSWKHPYLVPG